MSPLIAWLRSAFAYFSLDLLRRVEIRYRLITAFILLSLIPILVSSYISYVESTAEFKHKAEIFSKEVVKQVSKNISLRMEQIETESSLLVLSDQVQDALTRVAHGNEKEQSEARQDLTRLLLEHYGAVDFINQKYASFKIRVAGLAGQVRASARRSEYLTRVEEVSWDRAGCGRMRQPALQDNVNR
ncbi:hypothetical protein [Paraburkholderia sp. MM6662-R1]|uniref:hypothetical protein n=1 Tax=Paraburkholderia sp. MM6662-R1 TaxID=2991066 RepID=UPI003D201C9F